jgi:hypothetical protein
MKTNKIINDFQNEMTVFFFEMLLTIKLFHWKTHQYSIHKATDELYDKMNEKMDQFIEVLLGKTNIRINLSKKKNISLNDISTLSLLQKKIKNDIGYLLSIENTKAMQVMRNVDLYTIRDEMIAILNQFLYLTSMS